jgi:hypothetical protein
MRGSLSLFFFPTPCSFIPGVDPFLTLLHCSVPEWKPRTTPLPFGPGQQNAADEPTRAREDCSTKIATPLALRRSCTPLTSLAMAWPVLSFLALALTMLGLPFSSGARLDSLQLALFNQFSWGHKHDICLVPFNLHQPLSGFLAQSFIPLLSLHITRS